MYNLLSSEYPTQINNLLWVNAFFFCIVMMFAFWDLPRNNLFLSEYSLQEKMSLQLNKARWYVAVICLALAFIVAMFFWVIVLFMLGLI